MNRTNEKSDKLGGLMRLAQDGDRTAYRVLLKEIAAHARRFLRYRYGALPEADAEDIVQDILLAVHSVRATYDAARPFLPWLMAIARYRTIDAARRYGRLRAREVVVEEYPETSDVQETNMPAEGYGDRQALQEALQVLPKGQRTAIELVKLREMSLKEASAVSGMSIGALKVATHRATRALRLALKGRDTSGY